MAEETDQKKAPEAPPATATTVSDESPVTEKITIQTNPSPVPEPEPELAEKSVVAPVEEVAEPEKAAKPEEKIAESASFKEETNVVGELPDPQKKALDDLKLLVQEALNNHQFTEEEPKPVAVEEETKPVAGEEEPKAVDKTEEKTPPSVVVTETEASEKVTVAVVEHDGVKTVEAIEETVVSVTAAAVTAEEEKPTVAAEETKKEETEQTHVVLPPPSPEEVTIWGIPLLADERSDVILLKFLRARDFKVKEAFAMLKNTIKWRKEFGIESLLEETELGTGLEKTVFLHGFDKEGHPVYYNSYGEFQNSELYQNTFSDEEKRQKYLRWRIQLLEKSISKLDFSPDGINTFVFVNDLKNSPGLLKRDLRLATNKALFLLQDNYPEFVSKQVVINVPWWYLVWYRLSNTFFSQRSKSKFVFAGSSKTAETLFKYIAPEQVPAKYGGLSKEGDEKEEEFTTANEAKEEIIKPGTKHTIEIPVSDLGTFVWETRVVGWDLSYGVEFVPQAEDGYTVIVQKLRKVGVAEENVVNGSFKVKEVGKIVLTFDNQSSKKKKKVVYRYKTKSD
ncbi:patellin-3-like [Impatiens glandulifera]|uniref:patellin-3-like n=1 Tax=Impatiens glandulifera TaxID=253017 RepID=UPI001FB158F6|nr:patellin-3-like [Impatiens glandulifera]